MINTEQMQKYVLHLNHTREPITNNAIAKLHKRESGKLSGQEIKLRKDVMKHWKIKS